MGSLILPVVDQPRSNIYCVTYWFRAVILLMVWPGKQLMEYTLFTLFFTFCLHLYLLHSTAGQVMHFVYGSTKHFLMSTLGFQLAHWTINQYHIFSVRFTYLSDFSLFLYFLSLFFLKVTCYIPYDDLSLQHNNNAFTSILLNRNDT